MKLAMIPAEEATSLLRSLGLVIGQSGIYGPAHNVTQHAARALYPELERAVNKHGTIEITLRDKHLLVNGAVLDVGGSSGKNLIDRMALHKIEGVAFLAPANVDEFLKCVTLFGTAPTALSAEGGLETAMKQAKLRSVQVVNVTYRRVAGNAPEPKASPGSTSKTQAPARVAAVESPGVLDLADIPDELLDMDLSGLTGGGSTGGVSSGSAPHPPAASAARQQRATALAGLLRQAASMLEQSPQIDGDSQRAAIEGTFTQIHEMLSSISKNSETQIKTFAGQVHADRDAIADIESAARRRGVGLQLTRHELVSRYAELSQEIAQPLTVSSGVIELLNSGRAGNLSETQRDLLKMAAESVERVNQLVEHLKQISGMPESLKPDAAILNDAYNK